MTLLGAAAETQPNRTRAEIEKLIEDAGKTQPEWWDATALNYPNTLDLTWKPPAGGGWQPQKAMGAYFWDYIDPNPAKWHEGIKLAAHTLTLNKSDPAALKPATTTIARMYIEMLGDFPRGAYWARKANALGADMDLALVECYMKMGCPSMAIELLKKQGGDYTRNGQAIKLWSELGDMKTALAWADGLAKAGYPTAAYLAAGDACRRANNIPQAISYYNKVIANTNGGKGRDDAMNKKRAQASLDAIKLFDTLDLQKIPDGTFKDSSTGYVGPVTVAVTVKSHKITDVKVVDHHEKQFYASLNEVPPQIVAKQSVKGIDMTTGATITSEAIINASAKALSAAQK